MSKNLTKLKIINLDKSFTVNKKNIHALLNINLVVKENEFVCVVGPSGCGKSTLLYLIAGFIKPTSGQIHIDDKLILEPGSDRGFVFQEPVLFPWKTVKQNIMSGSGKDVNGELRAEHLIKLIGLEGFEGSYPHQLSGGMKQRVSIAMAYSYEPEVLLMDEPFGFLDAQTKKVMQQELVRIWQEMKKTVIFVTHSVIEACYLADKIVVMTKRPGRIKEIIDNNVSRPRSYVDEDYLELRKKVLTSIEKELK